MESQAPAPNARLDRYVIFDEIAAGGMATVHLGLLVGSAGFARTVAIKRLHPMYAKDPEFVNMFTDEARLAARIRHPNVAGTLDVITSGGELFLVMEYIHGESLARLLRLLKRAVPVPIATAIMVAALHGLHAAHQATNEQGGPLGVVHRDVSPQNIMIGNDGVARVLDFGIAKAGGRTQTTRFGEVKGKAAYMAPEQLRGGAVDARSDVYSASVVLWEALTGHRLFVADDPTAIALQVLEAVVEPPSKYAPDVPPALDAAVLRGMSRDPAQRPRTALELAAVLEAAVPPANPREIGAWVEQVAAESLAARARRMREIEAAGAPEQHERPSVTARLFGLARPKTVPLPRPPGLERITYDTSSQVSSISMATPIWPIPVSARRVWPWMFAVTTLVLAGMGVVIARRSMSSAPPAASATEPSASTAAPLDAPPPPASTAAARPPVAPSQTASTRASATRPLKRPPPSLKTPAAKRCNPPYTVDEDGIHIPKPECE